jgi:ApbE superfamily uncharacterized protein (UPF0280 family)
MSAPAAIGGSPQRAVLADGRRQHFQHGPIDLVIEAFGGAGEAARAYDQAWRRFETVLGELVGELKLLRAPVGPRPEGSKPEGKVARRMDRACRPHASVFVTPMAAVAGAVADEVLAVLVRGRRLDKAYVNNGGDIALHLTEGTAFRTGIVTLGALPSLDGFAVIDGRSCVRGIATSGWRGRSFSLGVADSVTVLARDAAAADVAATLIANTVDADDPAIERAPARDLAPDSDLGARPVTVAVGRLPQAKIEQALERGEAAAAAMRTRGLIDAALLSLQGATRLVGGAGLDAQPALLEKHAAAAPA